MLGWKFFLIAEKNQDASKDERTYRHSARSQSDDFG